MYPFCVFFIVEGKVHASSLWLIAVSKGLNTLDLTFDPGVCEKSKLKVRPKKKYARIDRTQVFHNETRYVHCTRKSVYAPFINMRWPRPPNQKRAMAAERSNENSSEHFDRKEAKD